MIKKLKSKIFALMMTSLSIVVLGIIILFAVFNCTNTINSSRRMMERVGNIKNKPGVIEDRTIPEIESFMKIENEKINTYVRTVVILAGVVSIISLIAIYSVSKKISEVIVLPVQETLEKQKQFVSDASHELKTPLAVIEANSDVLENEIGKNKWLTYIQNETDSMDKLINELLLLAKTENIDEVKNYEKINVSEEVEISTAMFESMAYEKQVKIVAKIQDEVTMNGNRQDIEHILSTLIDNAIKHSEPEKDINVELSSEKNNIILQVKNIGEPIPEEQRDKIFERFYRIDKSRNRNQKRYGLGLAIAKSIVEKYNGKIEVKCKDGITCFKIVLPGNGN